MPIEDELCRLALTVMTESATLATTAKSARSLAAEGAALALGSRAGRELSTPNTCADRRMS